MLKNIVGIQTIIIIILTVITVGYVLNDMDQRREEETRMVRMVGHGFSPYSDETDYPRFSPVHEDDRYGRFDLRVDSITSFDECDDLRETFSSTLFRDVEYEMRVIVQCIPVIMDNDGNWIYDTPLNRSLVQARRRLTQ